MDGKGVREVEEVRKMGGRVGVGLKEWVVLGVRVGVVVLSGMTK